MTAASIALIIAAAAVVSVLVILILRGRFGTAAERGNYELGEMVRSKDIPRRAKRRSVAIARGSSVPGKSVIGAGVIWLTDREVGFLRRAPKRRLTIPLTSIQTVTTAPTYRGDSVVETNPDGDFLIVEWGTSGGAGSSIALKVDDASGWAAAIDAAMPAAPARR